MKINKLLLTAFAGFFLLASCSSDDDHNAPLGAYDNGVLVLNEGGYLAGNASVSFISNDNVLDNNIFSAVNSGALLGDTGQDVGLKGDYAYIVVNNSHKVEVVNRYTFEKVATITSGLDNPRYIAFSGNKGYVTNWGDPTNTEDDFVAVIDLGTNTVTASIPVAEGPETIVEEDGKLYVAQKGGYGYGNSVTVINAANNTVATTITVGDLPGSLVIDDNKLYVLSEGMPSWAGTETAGQLSVINLSTTTIASTLNFSAGEHPANLVEEEGNLYYTVDADIYGMEAAATALPTMALFSTTEQGVYGVYAFAVNNGKVYVGDAMDYNSNGKVYIYTTTGTLEQTFTVGVIPSGFYFN